MHHFVKKLRGVMFKHLRVDGAALVFIRFPSVCE